MLGCTTQISLQDPGSHAFSCQQCRLLTAHGSVLPWNSFSTEGSDHAQSDNPSGEKSTPVTGWCGATDAWSPMSLLSPSPYQSVLWSEVAVASASNISLCPNLFPSLLHRDGSCEHSPVKLLHAHFTVSECFSGTRIETVSYWTPLNFCSFTYKREMIIANMSEIPVGIKWDNARKLCSKLLDTHWALKGIHF